ncbi:MAG: hypothetical protein ACPGVG_05685 [Mycobacterium sp.]
MPRITFTRATTEGEGGDHKPGDVLECSEASAQHWIRRGAAEDQGDVDQAKADTTAKAVKAPPKDKAVKPAKVSKK